MDNKENNTATFLENKAKQRMDNYKKHGVAEVEWLAALDERTCDECDDLNGKKFPIDEVPNCPLHPTCRCVLLPVIAEVPDHPYTREEFEKLRLRWQMKT